MIKKKSAFAIMLSLVMVFGSVLFSSTEVFATDYGPNANFTINNPYHHKYEISPAVVSGEIVRGPFSITFYADPYYDSAHVYIDGNQVNIANRETRTFGAAGVDYEVTAVSMLINDASIMFKRLSDHSVKINETEGGTASADKETANLRTTVTLTATPAEGYEFDSWDVKDASQNPVTVTDNTFSMPDADVTVTPVFKAIPEYTVSFDANGGSGTMESARVREGEEYPLPECGFTAPSGKEFDTWDKGAAGSTITVTEDTVVTAQWKDVPSGDTDKDTDPDSEIDNGGDSQTDNDAASKTDKDSKSKSETKDSASPKTGDESHIMIWGVVVILALAALAGIVIKRKRD